MGEALDEFKSRTARRRLDSCPPEIVTFSSQVEKEQLYDTAVEGVNAWISRDFIFKIMDKLQDRGVSLAHAYTYARLMWMVGADLNYPVAISLLAKKTRRSRQTVKEQIDSLEARGILMREHKGQGPTVWWFLKWNELTRQLSGASTNLVENAGFQPEGLNPVVSGIPDTM